MGRDYVAEISKLLGWEFYPEQLAVIRSPYRFNLVAGGERAGKSLVSARYLITKMPLGDLFWIVGPTYELARTEFEYALGYLERLGAIAGKGDVSVPKTGRCWLKTRTGQIVETKSSDDVKKIAARAPDGILMVEAAQQTYEAFLKCVGRVGERRGWLFLSGTFEGSLGWYPEIFTEWAMSPSGKSWSLPSWANTFVYPGGRSDPEILAIERMYARVPGLFDERCGAIPVPPVGLVFREFRRSIHVAEVEYDPTKPVWIGVDPSAGRNPYAVVACQFFPAPSHWGGEKIPICHVIDELYCVDMLGDEVIAMARSRPWWRRVVGGAIDIEAPDERKRWLSLGGVMLKTQKIPILHGIRREKSFLHYATTEGVVEGPYLQIHPRCEGLISEYGKYKRKEPSDDAMIPRDEPERDQPNHSIKALWYLLIARFGYVKSSPLPAVVNRWRAAFNAAVTR